MMSPESVQTGLIVGRTLSQRWPDANLAKCFHNLLKVYEGVFQVQFRKSGQPIASIFEAYKAICAWIWESAARDRRPLEEARIRTDQRIIHSLVWDLKMHYGVDWLQAVASLLGMLMHLSPSNSGKNILVNHRRPQKAFSTYPTSPAVARFLGNAIAKDLLKLPIPTICHRSVDAERYAERAFDFRVLDPSMESGQLLLEVALACVRQVHAKHSPSSRTAKHMTRAILEKITQDCLWGMDRNEQAPSAVALLFSLLGAEFGIQKLKPAHVLTVDALKYFSQGRLTHFDAVVNNPPWGETLTLREREGLRSSYAAIHHKSDTYVAFGELAIRSLRPGGLFGLILPSHAVATRNTAKLRSLFLDHTQIDQMIILPRSSFADATARGIVMLGRVEPNTSSRCCVVTTFPIIKRFDHVGSAFSFSISAAALRSAGSNSWWPLVNMDHSFKPRVHTVLLRELATISPGVQLYCRGRGNPSQTADIVRKRSFTFLQSTPGTVPAIRGRDVHDFHLNEAQRFVKLGKWLARVGQHDPTFPSTRIFVRELCRRDGKMTAAVVRTKSIPLHGVLAVVPKKINAHVLTALLNSSMAAKYVCLHTASFSKVDFQKITVSELRQLPIPVAALGRLDRKRLGLNGPSESEVGLYQQLRTLAQKSSRIATINDDYIGRSLRVRIERIVSAMYGLETNENV